MKPLLEYLNFRVLGHLCLQPNIVKINFKCQENIILCCAFIYCGSHSTLEFIRKNIFRYDKRNPNFQYFLKNT